MNKPVYLGLSILELSKTVMYEFWYDYVKTKYREKAKMFHYIHKKLMKDELGGKIMTEFVRLKAKSQSYLIDDRSENKKAKGTKRFGIKKVKFEDYKNFLETTRLKSKINHLEKSKENHIEFLKNNKLILKAHKEKHNVFTQEINKIALNLNDDKKYNQSIH